MAKAQTAPTPNQHFDTYWKFACERQNIFFKKLAGAPAPWTDDPTLAKHKFTNAYRSCDRVSQYLIASVIYDGKQRSDADLFFRIILFKIFNKIQTWQLLEEKLGDITWQGEQGLKQISEVLDEAQRSGQKIYSAAYIMPAGGKPVKHRSHLEMLAKMMREELALKVKSATSMQQVYGLLLAQPMIGKFLAYQYAIDLNYSQLTNFSENEFVQPGPGAIRGIAKCFYNLNGLDQTQVIKWVQATQKQHLERLGLTFKTIGSRELQLIDIQNLFCETDKYLRATAPSAGTDNRTRIKQVYKPLPQEKIEYKFPPKWGVEL